MSTSYSIDGMTTSESEFSDSPQIQTSKGKASPDYHYDDSYANSAKTSRNSNSKTGLIVGCIIGAVLLIGVIVLIIVLCMSGGDWESRCKPINEQCPNWVEFKEMQQTYVSDLNKGDKSLVELANSGDHKKYADEIKSLKYNMTELSEACKKAINNSKIGEMSVDQTKSFWEPLKKIQDIDNNEEKLKKLTASSNCVINVTIGSEKLFNKSKTSNGKDTLKSTIEYAESAGIKEVLPTIEQFKQSEAEFKKYVSKELPKWREDLKKIKQTKNYEKLAPADAKSFIDTHEKTSEEDMNKFYEHIEKNINLNNVEDVKWVEAFQQLKEQLDKEVTDDKVKQWQAKMTRNFEDLKRQLDRYKEEIERNLKEESGKKDDEEKEKK